MSKTKEGGVEEICLEHIVKDHSGIGRGILHIPPWWPSPWCEKCAPDGHNKSCQYYRPVHLHAYNVMSIEGNN